MAAILKYASIDHSVWTPPPYGGGAYTQVQYGDGVSDYSSHITALQAALVDMDADVRGDRAFSPYDIPAGAFLDDKASWSLVGGVYSANAGGSIPYLDARAAYPQRPGTRWSDGAAGAGIPYTDGFVPPSGAAPPYTFSAVHYNAATAAVATIRANSIANTLGGGPWFGANAAKTLTTFEMSSDCKHVYWDANPTWIHSIYNSRWGNAPDDNAQWFWICDTYDDSKYRVELWLKDSVNPWFIDRHDLSASSEEVASTLNQEYDAALILVVRSTGTPATSDYRIHQRFYTSRV